MRVHLVTDLTAVVFDACDGATSRSSVLDDLVEFLGVDQSAADDMVTDSLSALERTGLLAGASLPVNPP